jgi:hypothetical protein
VPAEQQRYAAPFCIFSFAWDIERLLHAAVVILRAQNVSERSIQSSYSVEESFGSTTGGLPEILVTIFSSGPLG